MKKSSKGRKRQQGNHSRRPAGTGRLGGVDTAISQVMNDMQVALKALERQADSDGNDVAALGAAAERLRQSINTGKGRLERLALAVANRRQRDTIAGFVTQLRAAVDELDNPDSEIGGKLAALQEAGALTSKVDADFAGEVADIFGVDLGAAAAYPEAS